MARTQTMSIKEFMSNDWKSPNKIKELNNRHVLYSANGLLVFAVHQLAMAGVDGTFGNMHSAIMNMFDSGVVLVIIFAGASWGLGHRPKAIEILIGVCCGYLLARHAIDIRDFLKSI